MRRDEYDERIDRELAELDIPVVPDRATRLAGGFVPYVRSYARVLLPFALAMAVYRALDGASFASVVLSFLGATVFAGVLAYAYDSIRHRQSLEDAEEDDDDGQNL